MSRRSALFFALLSGILASAIIPWRPESSAQLVQSSPIKRSSSAIAISGDGALLIVANLDSNSISLVDTAAQVVLAEIAVGIEPRALAVDDVKRRVYVANRGSDTVSVVDLETRRLIHEAPVGNRPYGLVVSPEGARLYVAESGRDTLNIMDTNSFESVARIRVNERPSGLAISDDGRYIYITHLLSKAITVLDTRQLFSSYLPLVLNASSIPKELGPKDLGPHGPGKTRQPASSKTGSSVQDLVNIISLWPDSNLVQSFVIAPDGRTAYVPHTLSLASNEHLTFDTTVSPLVSLIDLTSGQHLLGEQIDLATLDPPGVGLPFDAAVTPDGRELWVLNSASNDITVVDLLDRDLAAHIEVGHNPRGIVLSPDGATAYVNNALAGTVSVIDTAAYTLTRAIAVTQIPLPPLLLQGKRLFYSSDDPRMSQAQWIACNSCHFDGEHDGRTWFFSFAGRRNTTSLLGMIETYPLRWAGEWDESADSEFVIREENFGLGLLAPEAAYCETVSGDCREGQLPNQGRGPDLDALAAFIDSLAVPLSPAHARGEPLSAAEGRGQALFNDPALGCALCHPAPIYTDHQAHDVGTAGAGTAFDTPTLRGLYSSAPYFHDGSATTLRDAITRPTPGAEHDVSNLLNESGIEDLLAYLMGIPFE